MLQTRARRLLTQEEDNHMPNTKTRVRAASAAPPTGRPSLDERAPFYVTDADLERFVAENFPPTPEGRAAMRKALETADQDMRDRFAAAGWTIED